jgi:hypothetical protein
VDVVVLVAYLNLKCDWDPVADERINHIITLKPIQESDLDRLLNGFRSPRDDDTDPGRSGFRPNHPKTISLAKISPKPNITPFTNGRRRLMANAEHRAFRRVFVDREESNTERVADTGCSSGGRCLSVCS